MDEQIDDLLTALFNSAGWIMACGMQDRQKQYEQIRSVMLAAITAAEGQCIAFLRERAEACRAAGADISAHALAATVDELDAHCNLASSARSSSPGGT